MSDNSSEDKIVAKTAAKIFGGQPKVTCYWDENDKSHIDVLSCQDRPQKGVNSFSTIGLSNAPLIKDGVEYGVRLELIGSCASSCGDFANILSTAAFCIINSHWYCSPGAIFPDIVSMYDCSSSMQHLLFVPPFLWEEEFRTLVLDSKSVAWLLAVPISEGEFRYAESNGTEKLEDLFERHQIDIYDIKRPSII